MSRARALDWAPALVVVVALALAPLLFSDFYLSAVLTKAPRPKATARRSSTL